VEDERKGTNLLITADEHFSQVSVSKVGTLIPSHGFSSFKFIPGSEDRVIVALKSEEDGGHINSYVTVFTVDGKVLLKEQLIEGGKIKFEGIEFI
jgi:soluble calcium-activated nucleotidase 1